MVMKVNRKRFFLKQKKNWTSLFWRVGTRFPRRSRIKHGARRDKMAVEIVQDLDFVLNNSRHEMFYIHK